MLVSPSSARIGYRPRLIASTQRPGAILAVIRDRALLRAVTRVVRGAGFQLVGAATEGPRENTLSGYGPLDLVICDNELAPHIEPVFLRRHLAARTAPRVLFLSDRQADPLASPILSHGDGCNVLAKVATSGAFCTGDLLVTLRKILDEDIFGVEKYLHWGALVKRYSFTQSTERGPLLEAFVSFLDEIEVQGRRSQELVTVAEELLCNALFHAPVDAAGRRLYGAVPRTQQIAIPPEHAPELSFATDGSMLAVSCRDQYGSLEPNVVIDGLRRCLARGDNQVRMGDDSQGAGIGLYMVYEFADHLVINIEPGRATEFIAIVDIERRAKDRRAVGRSLNIFVQHRSDPAAFEAEA